MIKLHVVKNWGLLLTPRRMGKILVGGWHSELGGQPPPPPVIPTLRVSCIVSYRNPLRSESELTRRRRARSSAGCCCCCCCCWRRWCWCWWRSGPAWSTRAGAAQTGRRRLPFTVGGHSGSNGTWPVKQEAQLSPRDRAMRRVN